MRFAPNDIYRQMAEAGNEWAAALCQADRLEEMKKIVLAQLKLEHIENGDSNANAETKAYADERYQVHIDGMVAAREKADKARVKYQAACELSTNRRTEVVNQREQYKIAS